MNGLDVVYFFAVIGLCNSLIWFINWCEKFNHRHVDRAMRPKEV